jgi:hypothetical protein
LDLAMPKPMIVERVSQIKNINIDSWEGNPHDNESITTFSSSYHLYTYQPVELFSKLV